LVPTVARPVPPSMVARGRGMLPGDTPLTVLFAVELLFDI